MRTLIICALMAFLVVGCDSKPTHESIAKDMVAKMKEMVEVMKGIKDEETAKAAKPKLQEIKTKIEALQAEEAKLEKPSAETEKKLKETHEAEVQKLTQDLMTEMMRIGFDPKIAPHLEDTMPTTP